MAQKNWTQRMKELSERVDETLQEFMTDGTGEGLAPENQIQNRVKRKKRKKVLKNAAVGAGGAAAIGAGGVAAAKAGGLKKAGRAGLEKVAGKIDKRVKTGKAASGMMVDRVKAAKRMKRAATMGKVAKKVRGLAKNFEAKDVKAAGEKLVQFSARLAKLEG